MKRVKRIALFLAAWAAFLAAAGSMRNALGIPVEREAAYMDAIAAVLPVLLLLYLSVKRMLQYRRSLRAEPLLPDEKSARGRSVVIDLLRYAAFLAGVLVLFFGAFHEDLKPVPVRGSWYFAPAVLLFGLGIGMAVLSETRRQQATDGRIAGPEAGALQEEPEREENVQIFVPDPDRRKMVWRRVRWRFLSFWNGLIFQAGLLAAGGVLAAFLAMDATGWPAERSGITASDADGLFAAFLILLMAVMFSMIGAMLRRRDNFSRYFRETVRIDENGAVLYSFDLFKGAVPGEPGVRPPAGSIRRVLTRESVSEVSYDHTKTYLVFHTGRVRIYLFHYFDRWERLFGEVQTIFADRMVLRGERFWFLRSGLEATFLPVVIAFIVIVVMTGLKMAV